MHVIAISGDLGSGKSTVARILSDLLDLPLLSTGALHREIAAARNMSTLELNSVAAGDPAIDIEVDRYLSDLNDAEEGAIVDSRMAWWFIPRALKAHLLVSPRTGAQRAHLREDQTEQYGSETDANRGIAQRTRFERRRFQETYGVDIRNLRNYDVIVDTTSITPEECAQVLLEAASGTPTTGSERRPRSLLVDPKRILPSEQITTLRGLSETFQAIATPVHLASNPIPVVYTDPVFMAVDGHKRLSSSLVAGWELVPCVLVGVEQEIVYGQLTAAQLIETSLRDVSRIYDWEAAHGIEYELSVEF